MRLRELVRTERQMRRLAAPQGWVICWQARNIVLKVNVMRPNMVKRLGFHRLRDGRDIGGKRFRRHKARQIDQSSAIQLVFALLKKGQIGCTPARRKLWVMLHK